MMSGSKWMAGGAVVAMIAACAEPQTDRSERTSQSIESTDSGGTANACTHPICATGGALARGCDPCTTNLCALDPYCCDTAWDATCVGEVTSICGQSCTAPPPTPGDAGASTCAHPICATGGPLTSACEPCATSLCAQDPYCCSVEWDATCVGEVKAICGLTCN